MSQETQDDEMSTFKSAWEYFCSLHTEQSLKISLHRQHINENFLDLSGFFHSIEGNLEAEQLPDPIDFIPGGYFQVEQPSRIRYAKIIFSFTIIERRIRALVKLARQVYPQIQKDLSDYKGSFLDHVKEFVQENLNMDISANSTWNEVMLFQKVRDCIVHCGGNVFESRDQSYFKQLIENGRLQMNNDGYLRLTDRFWLDLASAGADFVSNGLDNLSNLLIEEGKKNI